jgi:pseudomonalisin
LFGRNRDEVEFVQTLTCGFLFKTRFNPRNWKIMMNDFLKLLALTTLTSTLAACGGGDTTTASSTTPPVSVAAQKTQAKIDPATPISVVLTLNLNNSAGLDDFIRTAHTPGHANFSKKLTPTEIAQQFGPTAAQVNAVTAFLQKKGFSNIHVADNNLLVEASASANIVAATFQTTLAQYTLEDGSIAHANTTPVQLPANLVGIVQNVVGLDNVNRAHVPSGQVHVNTTAGSDAAVALTAMPSLYNVGSTPKATNTSVAIITDGDLTQVIADLHTFTQQNGLAAVTPVVVKAGQGPWVDTTASTEWDLDSQALLAMSGGVKQLMFYSATAPTQDLAPPAQFAIALNQAVSDNVAKVINMSVGSCFNPYDTILKVGAAQGQTITAASGDANNTCDNNIVGVNYPAGSPYALAVGGTALLTNNNGTTFASESGWIWSGGGLSSSEAMPFWQAVAESSASTGLPVGATQRGVPDVAMDANNVYIILNGKSTTVGGTSLASPLFAGVWARFLSAPGCGQLGFAPPTLYSSANLHPTMFNDITTGGSPFAYSTGPGWDYVTGLGSPNISNMLSAVCSSSAAYYPVAQQLYFAYLGRPADPQGLANLATTLHAAGAPTTIVDQSGNPIMVNAYNTNTAVRNAINNLSASAESKALYPYSTNTSTGDASFVMAVFQSELGRTPAVSGLTFWVTQLSSGSLSQAGAPLSIMSGALATTATSGQAFIDQQTVLERSEVATNFTSSLTTAQATHYTGAAATAKARTMLQQVIYPTVSTAASFQSTIDSTIAAIVAL